MAKVTVLPRSEAIATVDVNEILASQPAVPVDPDIGAPTKLRSFVVSQDPRISVVPNFFTEAECRHLVGLAVGQWVRSLVGTFADDEEDDAGPRPEARTDGRPRAARKSTRTSQSCMIRYAQTNVIDRIEHRLASLAGLPVETLERLVLVRYSPGETFQEHHDGKFRPKTVFVYLNDLPDGDEGDTYFPHLGYRFVPRTGCAVMWGNAGPDGEEDSRMVHAGRPPLTSVKYGVNCFFNVDRMRIVRQPSMTVDAETATLVDVPALAEKKTGSPDALHTFVLCPEPKIVVVPGFCSKAEVEHILALIAAGPGTGEQGLDCEAAAAASIEGAPVLVRAFCAAETPTLAALEDRLTSVSGFNVENISPLRAMSSSSVSGLCNRGCGQRSASVCLSPKDVVFFPHIGMKLALAAGDLVFWPNAWKMEELAGRRRVVEDLKASHVHLPDSDGGQAICLDASFHDVAIRTELRTEQLRKQQQKEVAGGYSTAAVPVAG